MSKYTTEVRFICETLAGFDESVGASRVDEVLSGSWDKIFEDFEIFEPEYREVLCKKILKHYYTREIGFETFGLWKLKLNTRMQEIMPYYNKMYYSADLEYDPLHQIDYTKTVNDARTKVGTSQDASTRNKTSNETDNTETTGETTDNNTKRDLFSNTPQGGLNGIENETYLTTAEKITDSASGTSSGTRENTKQGSYSDSFNKSSNENHNDFGTRTEIITGKLGGASYSELIQEYRKAVLNVDMMSIENLSDLFLGLW